MLSDLSDQTLEKQPADQQLGGLLVVADLSRNYGSSFEVVSDPSVQTLKASSYPTLFSIRANVLVHTLGMLYTPLQFYNTRPHLKDTYTKNEQNLSAQFWEILVEFDSGHRCRHFAPYLVLLCLWKTWCFITNDRILLLSRVWRWVFVWIIAVNMKLCLVFKHQVRCVRLYFKILDMVLWLTEVDYGDHYTTYVHWKCYVLMATHSNVLLSLNLLDLNHCAEWHDYHLFYWEPAKNIWFSTG